MHLKIIVVVSMKHTYILCECCYYDLISASIYTNYVYTACNTSVVKRMEETTLHLIASQHFIMILLCSVYKALHNSA